MDDSGGPRIPQRHVAELTGFFAAHDRWLFGHACVRTRGDRELAADLVQDTFEAAARSWATLREQAGGRQRAWLLGTLANEDISDFRREEAFRAGYDADAGRARFLVWLSEHSEAAAGEPVQDYLKQVSKVPGLSAQDEAELARRIEAGRQAAGKLARGGSSLSADQRIDLEWIEEYGLRASNHLLEANLRLVVSVARRYTGRGLPFLDLIQEGNLGLIHAVEHFDYTKGDRFSAYATWWIRQAITKALADQQRTARPQPPGQDPPPDKGQDPPRDKHQDLPQGNGQDRPGAD